MFRDEAGAVVGILARVEEELPPHLHEAIIDLGPRAVRPLIDTLVHRARWSGYASIHAARLLGELEADEAVRPLLGVLGELGRQFDDLSGPRLTLWEQAGDALTALGRVALEPTLAAYHRSRDELHRGVLVGVLARMGVRDERIFELLLEQLGEYPDLTVGQLADYGDPRGVEVLRRHLATLDITPGYWPSDDEVGRVVGAIQRLGAELTAEEQEALERPRGRSLLTEVFGRGLRA
jgi:hypothetical protein